MILVRLDWFIWCCGPHFAVSQSVSLVLLLWSSGTGSATIGQAVSEQQPPPRFWGVQILEKNCGVQCSKRRTYRVPSFTALPVEYRQVYACNERKKEDARSISHAMDQAIQSAWINWESGDEGGVPLSSPYLLEYAKMNRGMRQIDPNCLLGNDTQHPDMNVRLSINILGTCLEELSNSLDSL